MSLKQPLAEQLPQIPNSDLLTGKISAQLPIGNILKNFSFDDKMYHKAMFDDKMYHKAMVVYKNNKLVSKNGWLRSWID